MQDFYPIKIKRDKTHDGHDIDNIVLQRAIMSWESLNIINLIIYPQNLSDDGNDRTFNRNVPWWDSTVFSSNPSPGWVSSQLTEKILHTLLNWYQRFSTHVTKFIYDYYHHFCRLWQYCTSCNGKKKKYFGGVTTSKVLSLSHTHYQTEKSIYDKCLLTFDGKVWYQATIWWQLHHLIIVCQGIGVLILPNYAMNHTNPYIVTLSLSVCFLA